MNKKIIKALYIEAFRPGIANVFNGFITYEKAKNYLDDKSYKKIGNNTILQEKSDQNQITYQIILHNTPIIEILPNNNYILNTNGYLTPLTKSRLEMYLPIQLYTKKGNWYFLTDKTKLFPMRLYVLPFSYSAIMSNAICNGMSYLM